MGTGKWGGDLYYTLLGYPRKAVDAWDSALNPGELNPPFGRQCGLGRAPTWTLMPAAPGSHCVAWGFPLVSMRQVSYEKQFLSL